MPKAALLIISLLSLSLHAQNNALVKEKDVLEFRKLSIQRLGQDALDTTKWDLGGNFGIQFTQASYSNWQAGGVNSIAGNSIFGRTKKDSIIIYMIQWPKWIRQSPN